MAHQEIERIDKPWGYELIYARTDRYAGKILHIDRGQRLSRQYHEHKMETLYVLRGVLELELGRDDQIERQEVRPGEAFHLPPGTVHRMRAVEDVDVLEVSSPELDDVVRIEDDYGRS